MRVFLIILLLIMSQLALGQPTGQPATLQGAVLTIPQGAVMDNDAPSYFTDIQLSFEGNGNFSMIDAQTNNLVAIDSVQSAILESFPVQVSITVTGNKSVPCVELLPPAISRQDNLFVVVLAETQLGPAESCIAVIDPFETTFALDVKELPAGTYTVRVNGTIENSFTLEIDNFPGQ